jgi:membrane fusion protein (multidrug efflux system)
MFKKTYLILLIILFALTQGKISMAFPGQGPSPVETVVAKKNIIYDKIHSASIINSPKSVYLLAESSGQLTNIYFNNGGQVKEGELLAQIDDLVAKSNLDSAIANLNLAKLKADRAQKLYQANAASQANLDQATSELAKSEADLVRAKDDLRKTKILAPFDGIVGFKLKQEFEMVNIGDKIFRIEQFNPLETEFRLPRKFYSSLKLGDKVEYLIDNQTNAVGYVKAISEVINLEDESFSVRASIDNPDNKIIPGTFTSIDVMANTHEAIIVPQQAIVFTEKEPIIYILQDGKVHAVPIKTGSNFQDMIEIKSGITENTLVIISGQMKLYEGMEAISLPTEEKK